MSKSTIPLILPPLFPNNAIVIASMYAEATPTLGAGETSIFIVQGQSYENAAGSYDIQGNAEAQAMDWSLSSGQRWADCAIGIAPAAAATFTPKAIMIG